MSLSRSESRSTDRPRRRGWSVRGYAVLFMVVLVAVAGIAGVAVRTLAQQDARQLATADTKFAASAAATEIAANLLLLQQTTAKLAANPQVPAILAAPSGPCTLTFAGASPFSAGHLDVIKSDGSVRCSSRAIAGGAVYGQATWLAAALSGPVTAAPFLDPATGEISAVIAAPVAGGAGLVDAVVELAPVGPNLAATLGGAHQPEFLVTTTHATPVLARSLHPSRWVGRSLAGTAFAGSAGTGER